MFPHEASCGHASLQWTTAGVSGTCVLQSLHKVTYTSRRVLPGCVLFIQLCTWVKVQCQALLLEQEVQKPCCVVLLQKDKTKSDAPEYCNCAKLEICGFCIFCKLT